MAKRRAKLMRLELFMGVREIGNLCASGTKVDL
jgi:hypothetical protein